jgi:hypothetical protein
VRRRVVSCECPDTRAFVGESVMAEKTCAACDCKLDTNAIKVKVGTRVVEVCCDECAQKLRESTSEKKS